MNTHIGLTSGERQFMDRGVKVSHKDKHEILKMLLLVGLLITLVCYFFVAPSIQLVPVAHAELSDKAQERLYCSQWATGQKTVLGGSTSAIKSHCDKYL